MLTILLMRMIMYATEAVVGEMGDHDKTYGRDQQPEFVVDIQDLEHQEKYAEKEKNDREEIVMMLTVTMIESIGAYTQRQ